eukprot:3617323-Pyramimonas_sp.AAC.1
MPLPDLLWVPTVHYCTGPGCRRCGTVPEHRVYTSGGLVASGHSVDEYQRAVRFTGGAEEPFEASRPCCQRAPPIAGEP